MSGPGTMETAERLLSEELDAELAAQFRLARICAVNRCAVETGIPPIRRAPRASLLRSSCALPTNALARNRKALPVLRPEGRPSAGESVTGSRVNRAPAIIVGSHPGRRARPAPERHAALRLGHLNENELKIRVPPMFRSAGEHRRRPCFSRARGGAERNRRRGRGQQATKATKPLRRRRFPCPQIAPKVPPVSICVRENLSMNNLGATWGRPCSAHVGLAAFRWSPLAPLARNKSFPPRAPIAPRPA